MFEADAQWPVYEYEEGLGEQAAICVKMWWGEHEYLLNLEQEARNLCVTGRSNLDSAS